MKKLFIFIMALFTTLSFAQTKIAVVDLDRIASDLQEYKEAQQKLENLMKNWQATLDSMSLEYQKKLEDYKKQESIMSEEKKTAMQKEIIKLEQDMVGFRQDKLGQKGELAKRQEELLAPIKKKISNVIEKVAKEEKISVVLDKAGDLVVLYADPALDLTYKVLDRLKRAGN